MSRGDETGPPWGNGPGRGTSPGGECICPNCGENVKSTKSLNQEERKPIIRGLARHAPFTAFGAASGIIIMVVILLGDVPSNVSYYVFHSLHPAHIVLSTLVTTAIYRLYSGKEKWAFFIGYTGSIGICTVSDIILPFLGGNLTGAEMEFQIGFIEKWWLINPLAFLGIAIGYLRPKTFFPHAGHVLLSTWASLFYLTAFGVANWFPLLPFVFLILFIFYLLRDGSQGFKPKTPLLSIVILKPILNRSEGVFIPIPQVDEEKCNYCGNYAEVCAYNAVAAVE